MKDTKEHLAQLCLIEKILSNVLPERDVNNPYKKHLEKHLSEDQQVFLSLLLSLSKQLTLLYRRPPTRPRLSDSGNEDEMERSNCNAV
jgi:hypothetical protein